MSVESALVRLDESRRDARKGTGLILSDDCMSSRPEDREEIAVERLCGRMSRRRGGRERLELLCASRSREDMSCSLAMRVGFLSASRVRGRTLDRAQNAV